MSTIISLVIAVSVAALSFFLWAVVSGSEYGFFYGVFQDPPNNGFAAHGPNYYQEHNVWYFGIVLLLVVFIVIKTISARIGSIASLFLVVNLVMFWNMITFKNEVLGLEVCCEPYPWLRISVIYDGIAAAMTLIIIILELISYLKTYNNDVKTLRTSA